jgi:hypothetical protein
MKTKIHLLLLALFFPCLVNAQDKFLPLYDQALKYIKDIESRDLEIVRIEFDILSETQPQKLTYRNISDQYTYDIYAYSDKDVIPSISIEVYDNNQKLAAKSINENNISTVRLNTDSAQSYSIYVIANKFSESELSGPYILFITHEIPEPITSSVNVDCTTDDFHFKSPRYSAGYFQQKNSDSDKKFIINNTYEQETNFCVDKDYTRFIHNKGVAKSIYKVNKVSKIEEGKFYFEVTDDTGKSWVLYFLNTNNVYTISLYNPDDDSVNVYLIE